MAAMAAHSVAQANSIKNSRVFVRYLYGHHIQRQSFTYQQQRRLACFVTKRKH